MIDIVDEYLSRYDDKGYLYIIYSCVMTIVRPLEKALVKPKFDHIDSVVYCDEFEVIDIINMNDIYDVMDNIKYYHTHTFERGKIIQNSFENDIIAYREYKYILNETLELWFWSENRNLMTESPDVGNIITPMGFTFHTPVLDPCYDITGLNRKVVVKHYNGTYCNVYDVVDGKIHGELRIYYDIHNLAVRMTLNNGVVSGDAVVNARNGDPILKGVVNNGLFTGDVWKDEIKYCIIDNIIQ